MLVMSDEALDRLIAESRDLRGYSEGDLRSVIRSLVAAVGHLRSDSESTKGNPT